MADAAVLAAVLLVLAARVSPRAAGALSTVREVVTPVAAPLAWLVAIVAVSGSLYFSEVENLIPCRLCWYQRIAMYPLVLILGLATLRGDSLVRRYAAPLAAAGAVIAAYHYQLERLPAQASLACESDSPCSVALVNRFGFISIPYMALSAFLLVTVLLLLARRQSPLPHPTAA